MPWSGGMRDSEAVMAVMAERRIGQSGLPEEIEQAVGAERAGKAGEMARGAIGRLDRDNHWTQEPALVYRAVSWSAKK